MKMLLLLSTAMLCICNSYAQAEGARPVVTLKTYGVKINVTNMDTAIDFYSKKLGFEIESKKYYPNLVELKVNGNGNKLFLNLVNNLVPESPTDAKASLTFQVNDYDATYNRFKKVGVNFGSNVKRKEGVGYAIYFSDPFGTTLSMMHVTIEKEEKFSEPRIYNYGIQIPDMAKARIFFGQLGFLERSQRYLPLDMPLGHADKSFGFMLHERESIEAIHYNTANDEHVVIMFKTANIEEAVKAMKGNGITIIQKIIQKNYFGKSASFRDSFGLVYEVVEVN